jgi:hypothetical protein
MPRGFFTSLFLELNASYWYLVILAFLLKLFLIRVMTKETNGKSFVVSLVGTLIFYTIASLSGVLINKPFFYMIPVFMFVFGFVAELVFSTSVFNIKNKRIFLPVLIGNGSMFTMVFLMAL